MRRVWVLFLLCLASAAEAHDLRLGSVVVTPGEPSTVAATLPLTLFDEAAGSIPLFDQEFRSRLVLSVDGTPWKAEAVSVTIDHNAGTVTWVGRGPGHGAWTLGGTLTPELPSLRTRFAVNEAETLVAKGPATLGSSPQRTGEVLGQYFALGITHILEGWDHLCFLFALLLGGTAWRRWLKLVSAFTLAHSLTLTLSVLGLLSLPSALVEPAIAVSIVVVAVWNITVPERDGGVWWALGFGLLHGFGFAGALGESGVPADAIGWALASFNLGVEAGQLLVVTLLGTALVLLSRWRELPRRWLVVTGSSAVALAGAAWFGTRVFGGV